MHKKPFVLGIVGGIASGKSAVADYLEKGGAKIIRADELGHQVLENTVIQRKLIDIFGASIESSSGLIDRKALAKIVFSEAANSKQQLKKLESVVHPEIKRLALLEMEKASSDKALKLIVLDAPLLFEAGWQSMCDGVLFVEASQSVQRERALQRGWTEEQWVARRESQLPESQKKSASQFFVSNDGSLPQLYQQLDNLVVKIDSEAE